MTYLNNSNCKSRKYVKKLVQMHGWSTNVSELKHLLQAISLCLKKQIRQGALDGVNKRKGI